MKSNLEEKKERPACHSAIISRKKTNKYNAKYLQKYTAK